MLPKDILQIDSKDKPESANDSAHRRRLNARNRFLEKYFGLLTIVIVLIFGAAAYYFFIVPRYQSILDSINTSIFEKNQLFPKYKEVDSYNNLAKAYSAIDPKIIKKIDDMIPDEYIKEDLFTELVYVIYKKGLEVQSLDVVKADPAIDRGAPPTSGGSSSGSARQQNDATDNPIVSRPAGPTLPNNVGSMTVKLKVSGVNYPALKDILSTLQDSLRLLDISQLNFSPVDQTVEISLTTYYLKK